MVDLKKILSDMAKAIVDDPDAIAVTETEDNGDIVLELTVAPDDMGKVIGKRGKIAKALRTIMKAAGNSIDRRTIVKIK